MSRIMVVSRVTCRWLQGGLERADSDDFRACDLRRWPRSCTGCSPDNAYTQSCVSFGKGWSLTGPQGSPSYESSPQTATTGYAIHPIIFGPHPWTDRVDRHHMGRHSHTRKTKKFETLCHKFNDILKSKSRKMKLK